MKLVQSVRWADLRKSKVGMQAGGSSGGSRGLDLHRGRRWWCGGGFWSPRHLLSLMMLRGHIHPLSRRHRQKIAPRGASSSLASS